MSLYNIIIIMFHQLVASKQRGVDEEYSELLMLSCSQSSIKLGTTGLEVVLQILSAIRLFRYQVTLLRSLVIL